MPGEGTGTHVLRLPGVRRTAIATLLLLLAAPRALRAQEGREAAEIERIGRTFVGRVRAGDADGAVALVDVQPLQRALKSMFASVGGRRAGMGVPSREERQRMDPGASPEELELSVRLDSMRHERALRTAGVSYFGITASRDSLDLRSIEALLSRAMMDRLASRATSGTCSPGMIGAPPAATTLQLLGAVQDNDSTGYLVVGNGGSPGFSTLPDYRAQPAFIRVRRDSSGWRIQWSPELHLRLASPVRWLCLEAGQDDARQGVMTANDAGLDSDTADARARAVEVAAEYFARLEQKDWRGAAALFEPRALSALRDREVSAISWREANPPPPIPSTASLLRRDSSISPELAAAMVQQARYARRRTPIASAPFLSMRSAEEIRALSLDDAGALLLQGYDPRVRHLAQNAIEACGPRASARPGTWARPRVLGAVPVHDSLYFVVYRDDTRPARPVPPVIGVRDFEEEPMLRTIVAVRTVRGWRVRHDPGESSAVLLAFDCLPSRR